MGVPSFYRWLVNKYPKTVSNAVEEDAAGECLCLAPNPNGIEFDNFYLDMNGIIHPCFHPEDDNVFGPKTFEDVFVSVYEYIDRLFNIVRPRKLLFLAIDGVAPRAKMNQQRARRFRTANDIQIAEKMEDKLRKQFEREGKAVFPKEESEISDSNVITPGTVFMHELSLKLQDYISLRMKENPAWSNIKVILSDDTVPGEGEHKIMSFIRAQRSSPGYDPNTRHCLYGLDADLIILALATHEIHFSILREEVFNPLNQFSHVTTMDTSIDREGNRFQKSRGWFKEHPWQNSKSEPPIESKNSDISKDTRWSVKKRQPYQFLHVWVLREYLELDLEINVAENSERDLERIIDDFIFVCFFAGNDFLPHIPGLEIHEGCLDLLMHVYKKEFKNLGGYLVDMQKADDKKGGYMKLKRVERFILMVSSYEEKIFSKRCQLKDRKLRRILNEHRDAKECEKKNIEDERASDIAVSCHEELKVSSSPVDYDTVLNNTKELKQKLKDAIRNQSDLFKDGGLGTDHVNFGKLGWKERYYELKFDAQSSPDIEAKRKDVVAKYGEGLHWVFLYYFSGVPSWTWFYPYHYGPLASDFKGLSQTRVKFQKGLPFKPFDQLMGVLPPRSAHALPLTYRGLMIDPNSNLSDFYPTKFDVDTDGKRFLWQGITKLPFIEEEHLLAETKKLENELADSEKQRNLESLDWLFVRCSSKECRLLLHDGIKTASKKINGAMTMESPIEGIKGIIHVIPEELIGADDINHKGEDACVVLRVFYEINKGLVDVPRLLQHVNIPAKTVSEDDLVDTILWHESNNANRFQKRGPMKSERKLEPSSQNPNTALGRGFSLGRGKLSAPVGELVPGRQTSSSSGWAHACRDNNYGGSNSGSWRKDNYVGFQGLRISDSNPRLVPNNRAPVTQSKGNNRTSDHVKSLDWRLKIPRGEIIGCNWQSNRMGLGQVQGSNTECVRGIVQDTYMSRGRGRASDNMNTGRGGAQDAYTGRVGVQDTYMGRGGVQDTYRSRGRGREPDNMNTGRGGAQDAYMGCKGAQDAYMGRGRAQDTYMGCFRGRAQDIMGHGRAQDTYMSRGLGRAPDNMNTGRGGPQDTYMGRGRGRAQDLNTGHGIGRAHDTGQGRGKGGFSTEN